MLFRSGLLGQRLSQLSDIKIVITGGKNEQALIDEVQAVLGKPAVTFVNELNLKEYAALAKLSTLFVSNSTGPLHIAAAVGTPVIGLYPQVTALSATRWGPYTQKKTIFTPHNKPVDCSLCVQNKNGLCECMETITVNEVFDASLKYLTTS